MKCVCVNHSSLWQQNDSMEPTVFLSILRGVKNTLTFLNNYIQELIKIADWKSKYERKQFCYVFRWWKKCCIARLEEERRKNRRGSHICSRFRSEETAHVRRQPGFCIACGKAWQDGFLARRLSWVERNKRRRFTESKVKCKLFYIEFGKY